MNSRLVLRKHHWVWSLAAALIIVIPAIAATAAPMPKKHKKPGPKPKPPVKKVSGTVKFFNHSPKGPCDSLIIECDDELVQANFPPNAADQVLDAVESGDRITVIGPPDKRHGDHMVLRAERIIVADGPTLRFGPPHGPPKGPGKMETLGGKISHWNYARGGEINGVVLDDGDFIHLGPDSVRQLELHLGQKVTARGEVRPLPDGNRMIEHPAEVNDQRLGPPHPPGPPRGPHPPGPPHGHHPKPPAKGPHKHHKKPPKKEHEKRHHKKPHDGPKHHGPRKGHHGEHEDD